jgi:hypothetical protein
MVAGGLTHTDAQYHITVERARRNQVCIAFINLCPVPLERNEKEKKI